MDSALIHANHESSIGEARRAAFRISEQLGFSEEDTGRLALVVNEGVSNLIKHAGGGDLIVGPGTDGQSVEVLFLDQGPGMENTKLCLSDGYSTAGTLGGGLGAVTRLSDEWHLASGLKQGTLLASRVARRNAVSTEIGSLDIATHCIPYPGESISGDAISVIERDGAIWFCVVDGLGHGPDAAAAARKTIHTFENAKDPLPSGVMERCHSAIGHTRGAAVGIVRLQGSELVHSGIGNIFAYILSAGDVQQTLISHDGIVGYTAKRFADKTYAWSPGSLLVMHSDGLQNRCNLKNFPGYLTKNVRLAAAFLLRDGRRGRDDIGLLVVSDKKR